MTEKEHASSIYRPFSQLNKKTTQFFFKWVKDVSRHFIKEDIQLADKQIKNASR